MATLPGVGPPPPLPAGASTPTVMGRAPLPGVSTDDDEIVEEVDDAELEEIDGGELLTSAPPERSVGSGPWSLASAQASAPPPEELIIPEPAPEPPVLDDALAEAAAADWPLRAAELRAELEGETDRARGALLAYELGELCERRLRDEAGAVKAYGRALQSDPSLRPNLWAIRRVFYRRGLWPNLLKLLDAEVRFARSDRERADLLVEKAQTLEDRLHDRPASIEAYEKAIALDPTHVGALLGRERQALADRDNETLLRVWQWLADASTAAARKAGYLMDRARLLGALALAGPPDQCRSQLGEALDVIAEAGALAGAPGVDPATIARARERLAELSGDPEDILAAADVRIALLARDATKGREIVALRRRQARVARGRGDRAAALRYLSEAATLAGDGDPILWFDLADLGEELRGDAAADGVAADALARLAALAESAPPAARVALALRRADALGRAGRHDEARALRAELAAVAPGFLPLLVDGERQAFTGGDLARVAALRLDEAQAVRDGTIFGVPAAPLPPAEAATWAAAACTSAGDLLALDLGRDDEAAAAYQRALDDVPGYGPAIEGLVALHLAGGRGHEAVRILEHAVEAADEARARELLERLAVLYEEQSRPGDAIGALERLLARAPDDPLVQHRLEQLYAHAGRHDARAALLERIADATTEAPRKAALYFELARVREDQLGDAAGGSEALRIAVATDPDDAILRAAWLAALRRAGRWEELAQALRSDAESDPGEGGTRALRTAAHVVARRLGRPEEAAALWRDLLDRRPDDPGALRGLAASQGGDAAQAAGVLEREVALHEARGESAAAAQGLVRVGELYEALGRDDDAAAALRRARDLGDAGVAAHADTALADLGARGRDRALLGEAFAGLAERTSDDVVRADLLEELAWLSADDFTASAERFDGVARRAPERRGAQLGRALAASRRRDARELAAALIAQAERTSDPVVVRALLLRAAALGEVTGPIPGPGGETATAASLAARAVALAPDDPGAIVAAAERPAAPGVESVDRAELLARRAALSDDVRARAAFQIERAETLERAGRLAAAGATLLELLAEVPDHLGALFALRRVARRGGDAATLARASFQLGSALADPTLAATHLAEAATLLDGALARPDDAAAVWRRVFELTPEHPTAFKRAHQLLDKRRDAEALIGLLSRKIDSLGPSSETLPHRFERALLHRQRGAADAAAEDLAAVLELDPGHVAALLALSEVRLAQGDSRSAADLLERYNETVVDPEQRAEGELRLAQLLEGLGDREGAINALDIVLTARPDDLTARERLVALLIAEGNSARAAEELGRLAERRKNRNDRARDELAAARMFRDDAGDLPRARAAYERCLGADPLSLEAVRELAAISDGATKTAALERAAAEVRALVTGGGGEAQPLKVLWAIAGLAGDDALGASAAGALEILGAASDDERRRRASDRQRLAAVPLRTRRGVSDDDWRSRLEHPGLRVPLHEAWGALAESAARLAEVDPAQLGFTKGDRIAAKAMARSAPAVDAACKLLGIPEIDLYVTSTRSTFARAMPLEVPLVLLSADVARGESLEARTTLARTLASARLRTGPVEDATIADIALLFAAGIKAAGGDPVRVPAVAPHVLGAAAKVEDRARAIARALSRKDRKILAGLLDKLAAPADLAAWQLAVRATLRRVALLVGGDLPLALASVGATRAGEAADLITFGVGETYLHLRKDLGLT